MPSLSPKGGQLGNFYQPETRIENPQKLRTSYSLSGHRLGEVRSPEVRAEPKEYSSVVETPQRRAGITNKPKVVQPYETHREPKRKEKGCSGPGTKPRRGIHCLGLTLKTHQTGKKTSLIPGNCCRIRDAA